MKYERVRTPEVIQMEAVECGVAALSIILRYYGRYVPLETLRVECGVTRDGSNAFNLIKTAQKYGLVGEGYKKRAEELKGMNNFPAILFWRYNHFLVLEGFDKDRVYLNDPAIGRRYISYDDFFQNYAGIVLFFKKGENFQPGGAPPTFFDRVRERFNRVYFSVGFAILTGLCLVLPIIFFAGFLMFFLDMFFSKNLFPWGWGFLGAVFAVSVFVCIAAWVRYHYLNRLNTKLSVMFSGEFFWHLLHLPMTFYAQRYAGEIAYRTMLNDSVVDALTGSFLFAIIDLVCIIFYAAVMFTYDTAIAASAIVMGLINLFVTVWVWRARTNEYARLQQESGKFVEASIAGLSYIESIKAKAIETDFFSKWSGYYARIVNSHQQIGKKDILLISVPVFFQFFSLAILLGIGGLHIRDGAMTVATLMALQLLFTSFLTPINRFIGFSHSYQGLKIDLDRLDDVLKAAPDPFYKSRKAVREFAGKARLEGSLELKNVSFGYAPLEPPLIKNFNLLMRPGTRIALVGPTGSGKSTIRKLASGLFHPRFGEILYDGVPFQEIPKELFCNSIATVDQEIFLFEGTIRENLTFWNNKIPDEMLIKAAHDACIHDEILRRGGYDSMLIEGGRNLSGGERQRLEIARALLYNPSLLILDEATSALDSTTEMHIAENVRQRGCSALIIAHRLSTIQDCDEILVLDQGEIVQRGTHQELKAVDGIYKDLVSVELLND